MPYDNQQERQEDSKKKENDTAGGRVAEQEALAKVLTFKSEMERANDQRFEDFVEYKKVYSLKDETRDADEYYSDLQIGGAFEFVERAFASLVQNTPSFELVDKTPGGVKVELQPSIIDQKEMGGDGFTEIRPAIVVPFKEIYESDLNAMWTTRKMKNILREVVKGALIYGTYHAEVSQSYVTKKEIDPILAETDEEGKGYREIVEKITPEIHLLEPFDVLVNPYARNPEDAIDRFGGFVIVRNYVSLDDLDEDTYNLNRDVLVSHVRRTKGGIDGRTAQKREKEQDISSVEVTPEGIFTVLEMICNFSPDGSYEKQKKYWISVAANAVLIRLEPLEEGCEIPIKVLKDQEVPGEYWGIGEIEPILSNLREEIMLRNQRIDYNNRLLNEAWLLRTSSGIDPRQLVDKQHTVIMGEDISDSALREVVRSTNPLATSGEDIDRCRRDMIAVTGSIDINASGDIGGTTNTATGETIRQQQALLRYQAKSENIEFFVAEIAEAMLRIKAKYLTDDEKIPVFLRGKWREVSADLYKKYIDQYVVTVRSGSMNVRNSITERNDSIAVLNILRQARGDGLNANVEEGYREILSKFPGIDVDKFVPRSLPESLSSAINDLGGEEEEMEGERMMQSGGVQSFKPVTASSQLPQTVETL